MSHRDHKQALAAARRLISGAVMALALILLAAPRSNAAVSVLAAPPPGAAEQFGANTGMLFNSGAYSGAQIDAQLAALARTGTTLVRSDALWERTEPQPPLGLLHLHRYDWSFDDQVVGALAAHGLRWLPIIDYTTSWAQSISGQDHSEPSSLRDYADFAAALAARYGPGGTYWIENPRVAPQPVETYEVWNEPDNPVYWYPSPNPAAYADLYARARAAILGVEPGAQVIIGGLSGPAWFLQAMLASAPGLDGQIDGVAIHPYARTPAAVLANVRAARLAMRADGLGEVPLYVTEFGWTTERPGRRDWAPASVRPDYIAQTLSVLGRSDCDIAAVLLYAWATPERSTSNAQDWFGISPPGAGPSADTQAFAVGLHAASAGAPVEPLCSSGAVPAAVKVRRASHHRGHARRSRRHRAGRRRSR